MYKSKICPICGEQFSPKSARQIYCKRLVVRKCVVCGKEYNSECVKDYSRCCSADCTKLYAHTQSVASYANITKTCVLCGKSFTPKNNTQKICEDQHFRTCVVCGKSFEIIWKPGRNIDDIARTCSPECKTKLTFAKGNPAQRPECKAKAKQTYLDNYGVDHPMHSEVVKTKVDNTMQDRYGKKRFSQTEEYKVRAIETNKKRYGTDWAMQNPSIKKKSEDTLMSNFEVTNPMQSAEIVAGMQKSYKAKTGYDFPFQNPEVKEKIKETNRSVYGCENVLQNPDVRAKATETMRERFGVTSALQSEEIKARVKATNRERYGYDNPAQAPEVQAKIANTMLERHGVAHYNESWIYRKSVMTDASKVEEWKAFLEDPEQYIKTHFDHKPNYKELQDVLGVNTTTIWVHLTRIGKLDLIQFVLSYLENDIVDILHSINPNMQIIQHERQLIKPYEIDIYLPEYKIGIEINPTSTHNSSVGSHTNPAKAPSYHKMKTDMCEEHGVFLFHIFGYEWHHKQEIIISMLRNLLCCNLTKIYARNCELRIVEPKEAYIFLQENHRQGGVYSQYRYGLYYKGELVSLMTFGKLRNTLGLNGNNLSDCWELVRFCNKLNTTVVGGASKLFKHFIREHNPNKIRSFSDRAHTKGSLYTLLGFSAVKQNSENYVWVNLTNNKAYNRVNAQKHNLKAFFKDDTIDLTKTERQIMEEHGYVRVYDSGTITWEWRQS